MADIFGYECQKCELLYQVNLYDKENNLIAQVTLETNCKLCGSKLVPISRKEAMRKYETC
jgi:hypothetical protein